MRTNDTILPIFHALKHKRFIRYFIYVLSAGLLAAVYIVIFPFITSGRDWTVWYRPAILHLLSGESPYTIPIANPPWALIPLIPLALLPPMVGAVIQVVASPIIFSLIAYKLGAKPLPIVFLALSSPVIHNAININIDWMPALGLLMPPQIGLFFVLIKPQAGIGVAVYWLFDAWKKDHTKGVIKTFSPVIICYLLSFAVFGNWLLPGAKKSLEIAQEFGNTNVFPWAVPLGVALLVFTIRKRLPTLSISASPLLSPYVAMHSWSTFLLGLINYPVLSIIACILSWVITFWGWSLRP